jgi:hypothetical protein
MIRERFIFIIIHIGYHTCHGIILSLQLRFH